ncbi:hypothetical protein [Sulfurimonas sp.]
MKKNLGKIVLFVLLLFLPLHAEKLASYTMTMSKKEAFVKEAVEIIFQAKQKNHATHMLFFLKPKKSNDYKIYLLEKETKELSYHNSMTTFRYILFPLKAKKITVAFNFTIKTASDQAVKQAYIADHDDSIAINMNKKNIAITPLILQAKKLKKDVDLVGDYTLHTKIDKQTINQYESVNLFYRLQGEGYNEVNLTLLPKIPHITQFFETDHDSLKLTKDGFFTKQRFIYSMSAKKDFTIPAVTLRVYSPQKNSYYRLQVPSYKIKVKKIPIATLLDKEEYPQTKPLINLEAIKHFFIYILIFLTGFITAKISENIPIRKEKKKQFQDIKESETPKELIILLLNNYRNKDIDSFIEQLEKLEYKGEGNFKAIKKDIIGRINPE